MVGWFSVSLTFEMPKYNKIFVNYVNYVKNIVLIYISVTNGNICILCNIYIYTTYILLNNLYINITNNIGNSMVNSMVNYIGNSMVYYMVNSMVIIKCLGEVVNSIIK